MTEFVFLFYKVKKLIFSVHNGL